MYDEPVLNPFDLPARPIWWRANEGSRNRVMTQPERGGRIISALPGQVREAEEWVGQLHTRRTGFVETYCWCGCKIVKVPVDSIRDGQTKSCRRRACRRGGPVVAVADPGVVSMVYTPPTEPAPKSWKREATGDERVSVVPLDKWRPPGWVISQPPICAKCDEKATALVRLDNEPVDWVCGAHILAGIDLGIDALRVGT